MANPQDAVSISANRWTDQRLVVAGAGPVGAGTPWGTLAEIAKALLAPLGYDVTIEERSYGLENTRYVGDGRADFGATALGRIRASYLGEREFEGDGARANLRFLAAINHPSWIGVATRAGSGIEDLAQLAAVDRPLRISGGGLMLDLILGHYGLSRDELAARGAIFHGTHMDLGLVPWARDGEFDLIVGPVYASYTPEARHWWEASVFNELRFLDLAEPVVKAMCEAVGGEPATLPRHVVRGATEVRTIARLPQAYYARDDTPDDAATLLVRTFDRNHAAFRTTHLPYSYDPANVARSHGVPLHPAAEKYYRDVGYLAEP